MLKFFRAHFTETVFGFIGALLAAVIGLVTYIGSLEVEHAKARTEAVQKEANDKIDSLRRELTTRIDTVQAEVKAATTKLETLQCEVRAMSASDAFDVVENDMLNLHLDAPEQVRKYIARISSVLGRFSSTADKCPEGQEVRKKLTAYSDALSAVVAANYPKAIDIFDGMSNPSSLSLKLLGVTLNSQSYILRNAGKIDAANEMHNRALTVIDRAVSAAAQELNDISKRRSISSLRCGSLAEGDAKSWPNAIKCYQEVIAKGEQDYTTYFNLARLAALTKDYEQTVAHMQRCLQYFCDVHFQRRFINQDKEFDGIIADQTWGPRFMEIYNKFP